MADKKITELSAITTAAASDILMVVEGPGTQNPANKKITFADTPVIAKSYTSGNLPTTGISTGQIVFVTNASTPGLAVCTDATNNTWAMVTDGSTP